MHDGTTRTFEEYRAGAGAYCCGTDGGLLQGDPPKIEVFMSGLRAIVYLTQRLDSLMQERSYFTTLDCDAEGKVVNRIRYPSLDSETQQFHLEYPRPGNFDHREEN